MKHRFLVGAGLAVATAVVAPWNAVAATIPSPSPADPVISGCGFSVSGSTYTLTANCPATATISVPDGVTLNGAGHTITAEGGFTGAVMENEGAMSAENLTAQGSNLSTGTCNAILGIFFNNASGSLNNVHVEGTGLAQLTLGRGTPMSVCSPHCQVTQGSARRGSSSP